MTEFDCLPVSAEDMHARGWWWYDFLVVGVDNRRRGGNGGTATDGGAYTNEGGALRGNGQYLIEEKGNQKGDSDGAEDNRQGLLAGFQNYG